MTQAARDYIDQLRERSQRFEASLATEQDPVKRALASGWLDATDLALHEFYVAQPKIEAESFFGEEMAA